MKRIPLAREGWPFVAVPAALAAGLFVSRRRRLALPFAAATLASLGFFRDPERVNRSPIAGRVVDRVSTPGRFVPAFEPDAGVVNERCTLHLEGDRARITVIQIAGVLARRIVCRVGRGDKLEAGERFGMIKFGSRTDCVMPRETDVRVRVGDRVRGGETVLGVLP